MNIKNLISELKRRNVFRVATAYAIAGWLIIQISDTVFPRFGLPDWTVTFVISLILIGFPLSLIFAWAFELTPEGIKKSREVDITESVTQATGKKINGLIIGALSLVVVFLLVERVFFAKISILENEGVIVENTSIAVLPFVNMSSDASNEYFSDGLSEELLNGLAKLEDLRVAGRTSSFQFKGVNQDLREVGEQLGVKHILEGSVRRSENNIRITAQLIQADNGFHLWSETYDRELTAGNIFDIQEEITRKVVDELKVRLLPEEERILAERPTQDIEAYNAFLEATQLEVDRNADELEQAIELYRQAVRIDPSFSLAYARLAYAYGLLFNYGNLDIEEAKYQVRSNFQQALLLNENEGKAYQARALYYVDLERDLEEAENAALKSVEILPNDPLAVNMLSIVYERMEKYEIQDSLLHRAYQLDPLSPTIAGNWALILGFKERFREAMEINERILERNPGYNNAVIRKVDLLNGATYGKLDEGFITLYEAYKNNPTNFFILDDLVDQALMLEMRETAGFFHRQLLEEYPDNRNANGLSVRLALYDQEYERAIELIDSLSTRYGRQFGEILIGAIATSYYKLGYIEELIPLLEADQPELVKSDPKIDRTNDGSAVRYSRFLDMVGQNDRAQMLREKALASFQKDFEIIQERDLDIAMHMESIRYERLNGNLEKSVELFEIAYFDLKVKSSIASGFRTDPIYYDPFEALDSFQDYKKRVLEDVRIMRENVIRYLKEQGDWRDEWDS